MSLDIKKVYIDSRFKTNNSRGAGGFNIELPRQFSVPDDVVMYIDDLVIPVSWATIDSRNNKLYF